MSPTGGHRPVPTRGVFALEQEQLELPDPLAEAGVKHLRTASGAREVDLIVERTDGRIIAIEVKLVRDPSEHDTRHLKWLERQIGDTLLDAMIITTGPYAYRRKDGIAIIPAALFGP